MIGDKGKNNGLIIYDDMFPVEISAFRLNEFEYYIQDRSLNTTIYSSDINYRWAGMKKRFSQVISDYEKKNPLAENKIKKYKPWTKFHGRLLYALFINNIYQVIAKAEKYHIPFVFTLYPGGGFFINNDIVEKKLKRVFSSPLFRKVIATQKNTYEYLKQNKYCPDEKIEFIYGGPFLSGETKDKAKAAHKRRYKEDKATFDICFMAHRYVPGGADKGYDIFIETCRLLSSHDNIRFHVVGGFGKKDIDVSSLSDKINFYGLLPQSEFIDFFPNMDIILSPNRPFIFTKGSFDGFPTASCLNAGSFGVGMLCSDELDLNIAFTDEDNIRIIPLDPLAIAEIITDYYKTPEKLYSLAINGQKRIIELFDLETQMEKRFKVIKEYL